MKFTPKTEQEIQEMNLMTPGTYSFEVVTAKDKISKSGKDMIELQLKVWDIEGKEHLVYDYLLEALPYKLRHFSRSVGLLDKYDLGTLVASDCEKRYGTVDIIIQRGQAKIDGGFYPDKNAVKDYIKSDDTIDQSKFIPKQNGKDFIDSEIPF